MMHFKLNAFGADRVVIGVRNAEVRKKIFQINFKSRDGSVFVSIPYAQLGTGRVGVVDCPPGNPESLIFGDTALVTAHSVKYSHHPDGEAHFSLDGKVFTRVRRKAVPLHSAKGHLFSLMVQGLHRFEDLIPNENSSKKRGIVLMPVSDGPIEALKFTAHLYSGRQFASLLGLPEMDSPWIPVQLPDGRRLVGIVLATKLMQENVPYLLLVSVERIQTITSDSELFVSLFGGFDPPHVAYDHDRPMSFLMMLYPQTGNVAELIRAVGSIDR